MTGALQRREQYQKGKAHFEEKDDNC